MYPSFPELVVGAWYFQVGLAAGAIVLLGGWRMREFATLELVGLGLLTIFLWPLWLVGAALLVLLGALHVVLLITDALDRVRRVETKGE